MQQVTIVVNFSLPTNQQGEPDFETYLHRIGRTGRFGKNGIAFSMVESRDVALVEMIEEHFREYPPISTSPGVVWGLGSRIQPVSQIPWTLLPIALLGLGFFLPHSGISRQPAEEVVCDLRGMLHLPRMSQHHLFFSFRHFICPYLAKPHPRDVVSMLQS